MNRRAIPVRHLGLDDGPGPRLIYVKIGGQIFIGEILFNDPLDRKFKYNGAGHAVSRRGPGQGNAITMAYTLKQLRYYVTVAELGSIAKATRRLNVSQPSISAAIANLEAEFGIDFFVRHHAKGLSLTLAGTRFFRAAKRLLEDADDLDRYVTDLSETISGSVEVGCILTLAPLIMPAAIASFLDLHADVHINCGELDHRAMIDGLHNGELDFAVMYDLPIPDDLEFSEMAQFPPYAVVPAGHRFESRGAASLQELADEPLILLDLPHTSEYFQAIFLQHGIRPNIFYRTGSPHMVRALVANGLGYSLLNAPLSNDKSLDGKPIRRLALTNDLTPLNVGLVTLRGHRLTRVAREFLDHIAKTVTF